MLWDETWDVKKVIDLLCSWGKQVILSFTRLTLKMAMILAIAKVKIPYNLKCTGAMQITTDLVIFQPVFGSKNVQPNHPYGSTITLRWSEDEYLCLLSLGRVYLTRTKDREM